MTTSGQNTADLSQFAGSWTLDPGRTSVELHTKAMWVLPVKGTAQATGGEVHVGPDGQVTGHLTIDAGSIDTKNRRRDQHLRTADFFEVDKYPSITFTVTGTRQTAPGRYEAQGTLTVRGETLPITLPLEVSAADTSATVTTEVHIDRSAWGLTWAKMGAGLQNRVAIRAHFDRA